MKGESRVAKGVRMEESGEGEGVWESNEKGKGCHASGRWGNMG